MYGAGIMRFERLLSLATIGAVLVMAIALSGCGSDNDDQAQAESGQAFDEVVLGLKDAAASNEGFNGARRANAFDAPEKAVLKEFCNFVWQINVNSEEDLLGDRAYVDARITKYAAYEKGDAFADLVDDAMDELQTVIDLASITPKMIKPYLRACYQ